MLEANRSNVESCISILETLIDDFPKKLSKIHERWTEGKDRWPLNPIILDYDQTIQIIESIFELRHILVHERPLESQYTDQDIPKFLKASAEFVGAIDWLVVAELHDHIPQTQAVMNSTASNGLKSKDEEIALLIEKMLDCPDLDPMLFRKSHEAWVVYAKLQAEYEASNVEGGSIYPMVLKSAHAELTADRIEKLKELLDRDEYMR